MLRIYLSGRMAIETDALLLGPHDFPGQQGRAAFAYLVTHRDEPVSRTLLADALWGERLPPSWSTALSAIVSKLRGVLTRAGADGSRALVSEGGCYELRLPPGTWIDHEAAADAVHEAEAALKAGEATRAYGPSAVARLIAERPFLPGLEGHWIDTCRDRLAAILVRALECRAQVYLANGEYPLAVDAAGDAVAREPFRETSYQLLMRAHAAAGNVAEALRVYEDLRTLIATELGAEPSVQTRAVHAEVLRAR